MNDREKLTAKIFVQEAKELGLEVVSPYVITDTSGESVTFPALLPKFGSQKGMLVLPIPYSKKSVELATANGFGYSGIEYSSESTGDRESFIDMLRDWSWTGAKEETPEWL